MSVPHFNWIGTVPNEAQLAWAEARYRRRNPGYARKMRNAAKRARRARRAC